MAEDAARLIVSVEAKIDRLEKQLNKATGVADKKTRQIENSFKKANSAIGKSADAAGGKMNRFLRGATTSATLLHGPLSGVGSRVTAISGSISRGNVIMAGFALTLGSVAYGAKKAIDAFETFEVQQRTLEGLVKGTGFAAGKTAADIEQFAQSLAQNTLASTEGVRNAAAKLLTFRSVAGKTFDDTLRAAQDLAASGFGTLETNVVQLGKALESPSEGLSALTRVGVSFSEAQKKVIKSLDETGKTAEAQGKLLEAVFGQVGGAGVAQAQNTLAGSYDSLSQATENLLVRWGQQISEAVGLRAAIDGITDSLKALDIASGGGRPLDQLAIVDEQIARLEATLAKRGGSAIGRVNAQQQLNDALAKQKQLLEQNLKLELDTANAQDKSAAEQLRLSEQKRLDLLNQVKDELDKQIKLSGMEALAREQALAIERAKVAADSADADLLREKVAQIHAANAALAQQKAIAAAETGQSKEFETRQGEARINLQFVGASELDRNIELETYRKLEARRAAGQVITDDIRRQVRENVTTTLTMEAAYAQAAEGFEKSSQQLKAAYSEIASESEQLLSGFIRDLKDGTSATEALGNALDNISNKLIDMATSKLVEAALGGLFGGSSGAGLLGATGGGLLGGAIIPGILHSGGVAGRDGYGHGRAVSPAAFAGAKRYHNGGIAGLKPDEVPAILQKGEVVVPNIPKVGSPGAASSQAPVVNTSITLNVANGTPEGVDKLNAETIPQIRKIVQSEVVQLFERKQRFSRSGI